VADGVKAELTVDGITAALWVDDSKREWVGTIVDVHMVNAPKSKFTGVDDSTSV